MDIKTLEKYLRLCRKHGVNEFKIGEIEVKLAPELPKSRYKEKKESREIAPMLTPQYSDMDTLLWSSGGVPLGDKDA